MSWWDIDEENVTGDGPADEMRFALDAIAEERERDGRPLPSLEELLGAFARALKAPERGPEAGDFRKLCATLASSPDPVWGAEDAADEQMVEAFARAFAEIETQYADRWERRPRRPELLAALAFVLRHQPEDFLSDAEGLSILQIVAR